MLESAVCAPPIERVTKGNEAMTMHGLLMLILLFPLVRLYRHLS